MQTPRTGDEFALAPYNLFSPAIFERRDRRERAGAGPASQRPATQQPGNSGVPPRIDKLQEIRDHHRATTKADISTLR